MCSGSASCQNLAYQPAGSFFFYSVSMFSSTWSWAVPLVGAVAVFAAVLGSTPPGFAAISAVVLGSPRGATADSAAYALGSAGSLALLTLLVVALVCGGIDWLLHRRERSR
jgi:hypothetical protein